MKNSLGEGTRGVRRSVDSTTFLFIGLQSTTKLLAKSKYKFSNLQSTKYWMISYFDSKLVSFRYYKSFVDGVIGFYIILKCIKNLYGIFIITVGSIKSQHSSIRKLLWRFIDLSTFENIYLKIELQWHMTIVFIFLNIFILCDNWEIRPWPSLQAGTCSQMIKVHKSDWKYWRKEKL